MALSKLAVTVVGDRIHIGPDFSMTILRTLRVPMDGKTHDLPAGIGNFPIHRVDDFQDSVPEAWKEHGGVFFPMWQREAAWLSFKGNYRQPVAVCVATGKVCAVTGKRWTGALQLNPQNYMVVGGRNGQPWLDGFKTADGKVSQFVAMPLGMGYTVEKQVTGEETTGGLQLQVFASRPDRHLPEPTYRGYGARASVGTLLSAGARVLRSAGGQHVNSTKGREMGLAAGGEIKQKIYDAGEWAPDAFDSESTGRVFIHIVNSQMYEEITGKKAPSSPITRKNYESAGYPWFELYDEHRKDTPISPALSGIKNVADIDEEHGFSGQMDNSPVEIKKVIGLENPNDVRDGQW